jgi:hypothetical protein
VLNHDVLSNALHGVEGLGEFILDQEDLTEGTFADDIDVLKVLEVNGHLTCGPLIEHLNVRMCAQVVSHWLLNRSQAVFLVNAIAIGICLRPMLHHSMEVVQGRNRLLALQGGSTGAARDRCEGQLFHDVLLIDACQLKRYPRYTLLHVLLSCGEFP